MIQKLINRLLFIVPLITISVLYFQKEGITKTHDLEYVLIVAVFLLSLIWFFYEISGYIRYQKRRRKIVNPPKLIAGVEVPNKLYYFNLKIESNNKEFQIFDNHELKIFINKLKGQIEIFNTLSKHNYSLNEIDFLVFEFYSIDLLTIKHDWGKIKWYCNYSIKLKNSSKLIPIVAMVSDRDNLHEMGDFREMDNNEFYYSQGLEIANILSTNMNMKYTVLNHMERKMKNVG